MTHDSPYDRVMLPFARWLTRHLNSSFLLLWLVKRGGRLHAELSERVARRLDELAALEDEGRIDDLSSIRANAPDAIPNASMRTLWRLLLAGRVKLVRQELDLYAWRRRLVRNGLTATLRLELREMLTPRVSLREPFPWPFDKDEDDDGPVRIRQLVDWEIVLSAAHVHASLVEDDRAENWRAALPALLSDFTGLLRDALDLMRELGGADDRRDLSYSSQPSISDHPQNSTHRDSLLSHIFQHHSGICGFGAPGGEGGMNNSTSERRSNRLSWRTRSIRCRVQLSRRTNFR